MQVAFFVFLAAWVSVVATSLEDTWAVLVCSSRYWFNYRHLTNTLSVYQTIRQLGVSDDHIIFINALDSTCNSRNAYPGMQFGSDAHDASLSLFDGDVEVDYQGEDARAETFLGVLTGRHPAGTPPSKRLQSGANSSVLIFLSGHGGDGFFKFHDTEELLSTDLAFALREMELKQRYKQVLLLLDTCQASTMAELVVSPRVTAISSSARGENSYAYQSSADLGVPLIDRFTHATVRFLQNNLREGVASVQHYFASLDPRFLHSTAIAAQSRDSTPLEKQDLRAFFAPSRDQSQSFNITQSGESAEDEDEDEDDVHDVESFDAFLLRREQAVA